MIKLFLLTCFFLNTAHAAVSINPQASPYILLPANASGVLTNDGAGVLSWGAGGGGSGVTTMGAVGAVPSANGASISGVTLTLQPADGTHPGALTTGAQTIAGAKTFSSTIVGSVNGNAATATALAADPADCGADTYATSINASGTLGCGTVTNAGLAGSIAYSKLSLTGAILNADLAGSIAASKLVGSDIATVGTITSGTWSGTAIAATKGGTGLTSGTSGGVPYFSSSSTIASSLALAQYGVVLGGGAAAAPVTLAPDASTSKVLVSGGSGANPSWAVLSIAGGGTGQATAAAAFNALSSPPTVQTFTSTGTQTGTWFTVSGVTTAPTAGATYTNNSNTWTVLSTNAAKTQIFASCSTCTTSGSTLTKSAGTGDSSITFSLATSLATYTTPANVKLLKVTVVGGGGGGGSGATGSFSAGGGGGGGATAIKYISSPAASYYYSIGTGGQGGQTTTANGNTGVQSTFNQTIIANPGTFGQGSGSVNAVEIAALGGSGGAATGGDFNISGTSGGFGVIYGTNPGGSGGGGNSTLGGGGAPSRSTAAGVNGGLYGGGGSGGAGGSSQQVGGDGAAGIEIVEEFY